MTTPTTRVRQIWPRVPATWGATLLAGLLLSACQAPGHPSAASGEKALFTGKVEQLQQWRGFGKPEFPNQGWVVENGWLRHVAKGGGGDVITRETFDDFELSFEWRIGQAGNSGVKYWVNEGRGAPVGHEYQVIDDAAHPDALKGPKRQTAALYDALAAQHPPVRPAGQVNQSRIRVQGGHVEHWLNGRRVLVYDLGSPEMVAAKAQSKFSKEERWGTRFPTPILLQDHGDDVWFRNIVIRRP